MQIVLQRLGVGICGTEFGRQLGGGLFEFRRRSDMRDRVPPGEEAGGTCSGCSATRPGTLILLLAAYDKSVDPSPRRQNAEIALARARRRDWQRRRAGARRR